MDSSNQTKPLLMSKQFLEWFQEEFVSSGYVSSSSFKGEDLPTVFDIKKICRGNMVHVLKYLMEKIHNEGKVYTIQKNLSLNGKKFHENEKSRQQQIENLKKEIEFYRNSISQKKKNLQILETENRQIVKQIGLANAASSKIRKEVDNFQQKETILNSVSRKIQEKSKINLEFSNRCNIIMSKLSEKKQSRHNSDKNNSDEQNIMKTKVLEIFEKTFSEWTQNLSSDEVIVNPILQIFLEKEDFKSKSKNNKENPQNNNSNRLEVLKNISFSMENFKNHITSQISNSDDKIFQIFGSILFLTSLKKQNLTKLIETTSFEQQKDSIFKILKQLNISSSTFNTQTEKIQSEIMKIDNNQKENEETEMESLKNNIITMISNKRKEQIEKFFQTQQNLNQTHEIKLQIDKWNKEAVETETRQIKAYASQNNVTFQVTITKQRSLREKELQLLGLMKILEVLGKCNDELLLKNQDKLKSEAKIDKKKRIFKEAEIISKENLEIIKELIIKNLEQRKSIRFVQSQNIEKLKKNKLLSKNFEEEKQKFLEFVEKLKNSTENEISLFEKSDLNVLLSSKFPNPQISRHPSTNNSKISEILQILDSKSLKNEENDFESSNLLQKLTETLEQRNKLKYDLEKNQKAVKDIETSKLFSRINDERISELTETFFNQKDEEKQWEIVLAQQIEKMKQGQSKTLPECAEIGEDFLKIDDFLQNFKIE